MKAKTDLEFWQAALKWLVTDMSDLETLSPQSKGAARLHNLVDEWLGKNGLKRLDKPTLNRWLASYEERQLDMIGRRFVLVLPCPKKTSPLVPVVALRAGFPRGVLEDPKILVALFTCVENETEGDLYAVGYRVEPPSDPGDEGTHDFFHVQHVTQMDGVPLPTPVWMPEDQPSIPLPAQTAEDMLICAAMLIYGFRGARLLCSKVGGDGAWDQVLARSGATDAVKLSGIVTPRERS